MSTFNATTFRWDDEIDRIEDTLEELEAEIEDVQTQIERIEANDNDVPKPKRRRLTDLLSESKQLKTHRKAIVWARDTAPHSDDFPEWDEAVDGVTLGAPRGRTLRKLQSEIRDAGDTDGAEQLVYIADGTVEAPYKNEAQTAGELAGVIGQLHPFYLDWCEDRIDALMDPEGNATPSAPSRGETSSESSSTED